MKDQERWKDLCEQAAKEHDPKKLMELTAEIIRALDEKNTRINRAIPEGPPKTSL